QAGDGGGHGLTLKWSRSWRCAYIVKQFANSVSRVPYPSSVGRGFVLASEFCAPPSPLRNRDVLNCRPWVCSAKRTPFALICACEIARIIRALGVSLGKKPARRFSVATANPEFSKSHASDQSQASARQRALSLIRRPIGGVRWFLRYG